METREGLPRAQSPDRRAGVAWWQRAAKEVGAFRKAKTKASSLMRGSADVAFSSVEALEGLARGRSDVETRSP